MSRQYYSEERKRDELECTYHEAKKIQPRSLGYDWDKINKVWFKPEIDPDSYDPYTLVIDRWYQENYAYADRMDRGWKY